MQRLLDLKQKLDFLEKEFGRKPLSDKYIRKKVNEYIEKLAKTWQRIRGMQQKRRLLRAKAKGAKPRKTVLLPVCFIFWDRSEIRG